MHFFHKERNIAVPDEDNVEELDCADVGESVGEAQHPTHIGQQRGHAVRLGTRAVKGPVPREFECTHVLFFCPHQSPRKRAVKKSVHNETRLLFPTEETTMFLLFVLTYCGLTNYFRRKLLQGPYSIREICTSVFASLGVLHTVYILYCSLSIVRGQIIIIKTRVYDHI